MGKLTALAVTAATLPETYQDGDGMMLSVKPSGSRSWLLRVQVDGMRRDFGLGAAATGHVSLSEARAKADVIRQLYKSGVDPVAQKRAEKLARAVIPTFREAASQCHDERQPGWDNIKHQADWLSSIRAYAFPVLADVRIDYIDAPMIRDVLMPIWLNKPETARRVHQRIRTIMGWAASKGLRPALDMTVMDGGLPKQPKRNGHFKAMAYEKVPAFLAEIGAATETVGRLALMFPILTAARSGETRGATWEAIDLEESTWTIPASRMKAAREHIVPCRRQQSRYWGRVKLLRTGKREEPIFPSKGGKPIIDMTISKVLRDIGLTDTVHGFRSAFKDWASEASSFPDAVSEAALAHVDRDKTRAAYKRTVFLKMRIDLIAAWANFICDGGATVINLQASKAKAA